MSFVLADMAARKNLYGKSIPKWHLSTTVAAIWVSRNWTENQIFTGILNNAYYAKHIINFKDAALFYFEKGLDELTTNEIILLLTISRYSHHEKLHCFPDKLKKNATNLQVSLNESSSKYGKYKFREPSFTHEAIALCPCNNQI